MSSQFGKFFNISTWGESHGKAVGVVIDGFPSNVPITKEEIQLELNKRKPGQSKIVTQRKELDKVEILSGVFEGKTSGTPISLIIINKDQKSKDYDNMKDFFRPSHADYTYYNKYGIRDHRGGGRSSARETIGRVAAGSLAKKWLKMNYNINCIAYVSTVGSIKANINPLNVTTEEIENNIIRCPDSLVNKKMENLILKIRKEGDSIGGVIEFIIKNIPSGLGEPIFDRFEANLAKACLSIPATKGFEIGSGFMGTSLKGSEHNDIFDIDKGKVTTITNHSGGVQGGITNGMPVICRVAFKPTATILKPQKMLNIDGNSEILQIKGRHDPCVLPRAIVIVEAMVSLVVMDFLLEFKSKS